MRQLSKVRGLNSFIYKKSFATSSSYNVSDKDEKNDEKTTHYGFQTVTEREKTKKVHELFRSVAKTYDDMNDAMSLGIHRLWKDIFIQRLSPSLGTNLLDMAGGTGDIAFRYVNYLLNLPGTSRQTVLSSGSHVTVTDINPSMLEVGKERAKQLKLPEELLSWKVEDGEKLTFKDDEFSAYTISFGIRNVTHIENVLSEAYRVLQPGGRFLCLEFSQLNNSPAQWLYDQYSFKMIPVMGQLITGKIEPYQYLVESIRKFPDQETFKLMIEEAGFRSVSYENLMMGVCAIHSGFKI